MLLDPGWLKLKLGASGPTGVVADFRRYLLARSDRDAKLVLEAFQMCVGQVRARGRGRGRAGGREKAKEGGRAPRLGVQGEQEAAPEACAAWGAACALAGSCAGPGVAALIPL